MVQLIKCPTFDSNSYLIVENKNCIVVDPGLDFEEIATKIKAKYNVVAILLTHGHLDHIDGIGHFDVPIYIHKDDYDFLKNDDLALYTFFGFKKSFDFSKLYVVEVIDGFNLNLFENPISVIHTPGHTRGSVCYLYQDTLFTGDTLFRGSIGRADFPTGNYEILRKSLSKLVNIFHDKTNITILSGHTDKTTLAEEIKYNPFLK